MGLLPFGAGLLQPRKTLFEQIEELEDDLKKKPLNLQTAAARLHREKEQEQQSQLIPCWQPR